MNRCQGVTDPGLSRQDELIFSDVYCREETDRPGVHGQTKVEDESENQGEKALVCTLCQTPITSRKEQIEKEGKHLHTFFNPAGIVYEIGCFKNAPGGLVYGPVSNEFAWFSEYSWQVVYCNRCLEHLGWKFSAGGDVFFGLIVNRLQEN